MDNNAYQKLETLSKAIAQKEYLTKKQSKLSEALNELTQEEIRLASILKKETQDYEKIEKISLSSLMWMFAKDLDERKSKEYQEMRVAEFKYQELMDRIESLQSDMNSTSVQLLKLQSVEKEYHDLMDAKLQWVNDQNIGALSEFEAKLHAQKRQLKETDEAIVACNDLIQSLKNAQDGLSSARNWGIYDILGGGLISSAIKHDHINRAASYIKDASQKARTLKVELKDIEALPQIEDININEFTKTFDIFFDNIFSDFSIQDEINEATARISNNLIDARTLLAKLNAFKESTLESIVQITEQRNRFLIDY
jgi:DNA repair exonuclease SbcCD ATPase subunit